MIKARPRSCWASQTHLHRLQWCPLFYLAVDMITTTNREPPCPHAHKGSDAWSIGLSTTRRRHSRRLDKQAISTCLMPQQPIPTDECASNAQEHSWQISCRIHEHNHTHAHRRVAWVNPLHERAKTVSTSKFANHTPARVSHLLNPSLSHQVLSSSSLDSVVSNMPAVEHCLRAHDWQSFRIQRSTGAWSQLRYACVWLLSKCARRPGYRPHMQA